MSQSSNWLSHPQAARAALLSVLEHGYPLVAIGMFALLSICLAGLVVNRRSPGRLRSMLARAALAGSTTLLVFILIECSVAAYLSWLHRLPHLAMVHGTARPAASDDATIIVVGESSAEGVPYRDWFSVGKIVAWQLRRLLPQRMFHVEVQARAGWTLEKMHQKLAESRECPDAVILYAGHNEFASRFGWSWEVPYYRDEPRPSWWFSLAEKVAARSPLCRLLREARDQALVAAPPPARRCLLVDVPSYTARQYQERLEDFTQRVEMILSDLKAAGVLAIVIVPPGNDAGFEPDRSVLPAETPRAEREAFSAAFQNARDLELTHPDGSIERYRNLIALQPGFAETHFRLGRLLQTAGDDADAYRQFVLARDLDGHPMRCTTAFQDVYRELAPRYGAVLIDGQEIFRAHHPRGLLDDHLFNDGMHPSFEGYVALAHAVLTALKERQAFGWPASLRAPALDLEECAGHFELSIATWKEVCRFAAGFYRTTRRIRYDPVERAAKERLYEAALQRLEEGQSPESLDLPGIGIRPSSHRMKHPSSSAP